MTLQPAVSILGSFGEAKALDSCVDIRGFDVTSRHRFADDLPLYIGLRKGDCVLHVSEHFGDGTPGTVLRIEVPDTDALCAALNAKRYRRASSGLQDQDRGNSELTITGPFGNRRIIWTESPAGSPVASARPA